MSACGWQSKQRIRSVKMIKYISRLLHSMDQTDKAWMKPSFNPFLRISRKLSMAVLDSRLPELLTIMGMAYLSKNSLQEWSIPALKSLLNQSSPLYSVL